MITPLVDLRFLLLYPVSGIGVPAEGDSLFGESLFANSGSVVDRAVFIFSSEDRSH